MNIRFIRLHKAVTAIFIYLVLMIALHIMKPNLLYDTNGAFRQFGVGYREKTILPIWIISILFAIFSYLMVLIYTTI